MIQATGDIGTQWTLDLSNGIVEKDCKEHGLNMEDAMDHSRWMCDGKISK